MALPFLKKWQAAQLPQEVGEEEEEEEATIPEPAPRSTSTWQYEEYGKWHAFDDAAAASAEAALKASPLYSLLATLRRAT
jgi:hypothetical protein